MFHPKVTAGALAGAATAILISELARHGVSLAPDEAAGISTVLSFIAGFFMPGDAVPAPIAAPPPAAAPPQAQAQG